MALFNSNPYLSQLSQGMQFGNLFQNSGFGGYNPYSNTNLSGSYGKIDQGLPTQSPTGTDRTFTSPMLSSLNTQISQEQTSPSQGLLSNLQNVLEPQEPPQTAVTEQEAGMGLADYAGMANKIYKGYKAWTGAGAAQTGTTAATSLTGASTGMGVAGAAGIFGAVALGVSALHKRGSARKRKKNIAGFVNNPEWHKKINLTQFDAAWKEIKRRNGRYALPEGTDEDKMREWMTQLPLYNQQQVSSMMGDISGGFTNNDSDAMWDAQNRLKKLMSGDFGAQRGMSDWGNEINASYSDFAK